MSSVVSFRNCTCHCHEHYHEAERELEKSPYLIEWEEFLNKFASKRSDGDSTITSPLSSTDSDEEDDIMPDEENAKHFRLRMLQRHGWNGISSKIAFETWKILDIIIDFQLWGVFWTVFSLFLLVK